MTSILFPRLTISDITKKKKKIRTYLNPSHTMHQTSSAWGMSDIYGTSMGVKRWGTPEALKDTGCQPHLWWSAGPHQKIWLREDICLK